MKPQYNSPGINFSAGSGNTKMKNVITLFDVKMNVGDLKHDILPNISFDANQLAEFIRSVVEKSLSEKINLFNKNNEDPVKELLFSKKDLKTELWVDDEIHLTCREIEVMERLSKGRINKEIAADLGIKFNTVRNHLQNIYHKLRTVNRSEAIIACLKSRPVLRTFNK